jgi:hypothetical protein
MVLLFRRLYELRAEEAAAGGPVVVVGPPGAGKTTFIKQFLEARGVEAAEETAGLAPGGAAGEGLVKRLRMLVGGKYVRGDEVERELAGIKGAELLKALEKLPRDFVEHLRKYVGYSLYLFYIPPDAEYEEARRLRAVMEEVGVEFRWLGLPYLPPGLAKALAEKGEDHVRRQLRLYKELAEELDVAEGRLSKAAKAAESALESLLGQVKEAVGLLMDVAAPGSGVAASILADVLTALLFSRGGWDGLVKLVAGLGELDGDLRSILAARLALALRLDREAVERALGVLAGAGAEKLAEEVKALKDAVDGLWVEVKSAKRGVLFLEDVELGGLYENFVVLNERPYVDLREGLFPLVAGGRFEEEAGRVLEKLKRDGVAVLVGPKGIGKSSLAAYVVWRMLRGGEAEAAVRVEKSAKELTLKRTMEFVKRKTAVLYDPSPLEVYYKHEYMEKAERPEEVVKTLEELADFLQSGGGGVRLLVVLPTDLYEVVKDKVSEVRGAVLEVRLNDWQFLNSVIKTYSSCEGEYSKLAEEIAQFNGGYTLAAKYAGLWLKSNGCDAGDVERALEASRREPKLFFAFYIRDVLLWRSSEEERVRLMYRAAAPLLLHAVFGPVPEGITYITQAKSEGVFYQPEEIEKLTQPQWDLLKASLQPIAHWLAQRHEDLVEEALRDLAGLHREEDREPYKEALSGLIGALDWARGEVLKEGGEILAELGVPEKDRGLVVSLLAFVNRRLAAVFKGGEGKRCWQRAALIAGHALAGHIVLPRREQLPEDAAEALGDALRPCAVDAYLTIDGEIPPLSIHVAQLAHIRELNILSPFADAEAIKAAKKTAEELAARWRRRGFGLPEVFYALGLATLAAGAEADGETAYLLLHAASSAVQEVARPAAVLPVLAALRPLGEKAPHRYVVTLAAASELETLDQETAQYIYYALQQLRSRLLKAERRWPLVEAIHAYSNLLIKHHIHIRDRQEDAVADMCRLYGEVGKRGAAAALDRGPSAQRLLDAAAGTYVLAAALESDDLAPLVREHCGLGDLVKEAEAVRSALEEAAARPDELGKIAESDADFAEWLTAHNVMGDAGRVVENLRSWFTAELAYYKLDHALDERGELDAEKLEEAAGEFEKAAKIREKPEHWGNYLAARGWALRARVLAAKSWGGLLERAKGFRDLWREAEEHREPTAGYLTTAAFRLGEYLVYLAASGDRERAKDLLKERRWLLDYVPEVSVAARLMLRLFGVGEGARQEEVVEAFGPHLPPEFRPALSMLAGRLQRDKAPDECAKLPEAELCVDAVASAAGNRVATERLRSGSGIEKVVPETRPLLDRVDGRTLVEVLAPEYSLARLAFMLLAAVEGRADAVRLHGLLGSARLEEPLPQRLFRAVYESCSDLNGERCKMALLKLYYYHL